MPEISLCWRGRTGVSHRVARLAHSRAGCYRLARSDRLALAVALVGRLAMSRIVFVLNGPNLNLLGKRQPHIYGHETLADVERDCRALAGELQLDVRFHQSNREYELIDWIHEARETAAGIVINPAAFTHTSVAILDALNAFDAPIIEVHISNVHKREPFRHHSYVSSVASGVIAGFGTQGYLLALQRMARLLDASAK
jgi:3-dehydroquinate dehydratase-2